MLLDEHQAKSLFAAHGIPVPRGMLAAFGQTPEPDFPPPWFAKALVLSGGRGKAGGVLEAASQDELAQAARRLFETRIKGRRPPLLRVEQACRVERELYLSLAVSRERASLVLTTGKTGGVDIEDQEPGNLRVQEISLLEGLMDHHLRTAFHHLELEAGLYPAFADLVARLMGAVVADHLLLAEINPLALTPDGLLALDGKVTIDDNILQARPELAHYDRPEHAGARENRARAAGLAYHSLDGVVGLMANGAGLAMATMDQLNASGLPAANFLDLGGGADARQMGEAFALLFDDPGVEAVFLNLFGGILSCEDVARAMLEALGGMEPPKRVVVRLAGNGSEAGRHILGSAGLEGVELASDTADALARLAAMIPPREPLGPRVESAAPAPPPEPRRRTRTPAAHILLPPECGVLVQGITGRAASSHTRLMREYGTDIRAGVTPGKGGGQVHGVPVYDTVAQAREAHDIHASVIFVPARFARDAVMEAAAAGIPLVVCITEGIPQADMLKVLERLPVTDTTLVGPNTPGIVVPGRTRLGIAPGAPFTPGPVAVLSRSGTLTYEAAARLSAAGLGQSLALGIGGDPFVGAGFADCLLALEHDPETRAVLLLGEIGGRAEEAVAHLVSTGGFTKPVVCFIAGLTAPPGKTLGHAGAILEGPGGVASKLSALAHAGIPVAGTLADIPGLVRAAV